jgi:peptidoglycan/LPS O-acetylase OafA/YrhL
MEEQEKTNVEIQAITFLRFISIALVLLSHNPFHAFKISVLGVDIFFLISGFLITKQIEDLIERYPKKEAIKLFYFRRARRILPSLITTLIFTLVTYRFIASSTLFNLARETSLPALGFFANFFLNSQKSSPLR